MVQAVRPHQLLNELLAKRLVRYVDLKPCTTAFIDTRTPGRQEKENFTIIGSGVTESPDQHIHIEEPHGFNIGGARQPPGCINSQHSHETAEVFIIHSGRWAFYLGSQCEDGEVVLGPGDTISIPIHVFRGFKNIGEDIGYMFAVLGGDDPGHVTWAPDVFKSAEKFGLVLLEDGSLIDTSKGEAIPEGKKAMTATTVEDVDRLRRMSGEELADCVASHEDVHYESDKKRSLVGLVESPIIGAASTSEGFDAGKMAWPHGFHVRHVVIESGTTSKRHQRHEEEVIMVHKGSLVVHFDEGDAELAPGDVLTVPIGKTRSFSNRGDQMTETYVVRGGDHPLPPQLVE